MSYNLQLSFSSTTTNQIRKSLMCFCHTCGALHRRWREIRWSHPSWLMRKVGQHVQCMKLVHGCVSQVTTLVQCINSYSSRQPYSAYTVKRVEPPMNHLRHCYPKCWSSSGGIASVCLRGTWFLEEVRGSGLCLCVLTGSCTWWFPCCVAAYANDIVLAIQRSQMLICLLSADYLSNSSAVFVLESGVKVGL